MDTINGFLSNIDAVSFFFGMVYLMITDCFLSLINWLIQKAYNERNKRKELK